MKKIAVLAISIFATTAIFAQSRDGRNDRFNNNNSYNNRGYNNSRDVVLGRSQGSYNNVYNYPAQRSNDRYDDQRRREETDRINRDYDQRINGYRNDRSINEYERNRRIGQADYERNQKLKSFAGGAVVGAIAGVILGTVLSH